MPAPILPNTPTAQEAELLHLLERTADEDLVKVIDEHEGVYKPLDEAKVQPIYLLRQIISAGLRDGLVIDKHYKMVDGTSFAAPIVSSVVAQMLEANPDLTPAQVKKILMSTARRLPGVEVDKQGWGAIQPALAVQRALESRAEQ